MDVNQPHPGEELNTDGGETVPRPAASIVVVRGGGDRLELLLVQRTHQARFMAGVWVFPGGAVDAGETTRDAGLRELREEAGVTLADPAALVPFSRWITPAMVKTRFDTWFFLAPLPPNAEPAIDGEECVAMGWHTPQGALDAHGRGELDLVFPTIKHLEQFALFDSADALLAYAAGREVRPVQPKVVLSGETARLLLPGDPGYEE